MNDTRIRTVVGIRLSRIFYQCHFQSPKKSDRKPYRFLPVKQTYALCNMIDRLLQVDKAIRFNNTLKMKIVTLQNSTVVTEYSNKFYEQNVSKLYTL